MNADTPQQADPSSTAPTAGTEHRGSVPLEPKMQRVVEGAHHTIDRLADSAAPHVRRLQESLDTANERAHRGVEHAREQADVWAESMRGTVRSNPLGALVCAFGLGWLIGRLSR